MNRGEQSQVRRFLAAAVFVVLQAVDVCGQSAELPSTDDKTGTNPLNIQTVSVRAGNGSRGSRPHAVSLSVWTRRGTPQRMMRSVQVGVRLRPLYKAVAPAVGSLAKSLIKATSRASLRCRRGSTARVARVHEEELCGTPCWPCAPRKLGRRQFRPACVLQDAK